MGRSRSLVLFTHRLTPPAPHGGGKDDEPRLPLQLPAASSVSCCSGATCSAGDLLLKALRDTSEARTSIIKFKDFIQINILLHCI